MNVLIIEDNPIDAMSLTKTLQNVMDGDLDVHQEGCLTEALAYIKAQPDKIDLVFIDLNLPDSKNWQETQEAISPFTETFPFIVISGDDNKEAAHTLLSDGVEDYIVKGGAKHEIGAIREVIDFAMARHGVVEYLSEEVENKKQVVHWMMGGYSVED